MKEETKTAEEQLIRDLIDKYMNFKSGAESTSIQHYGEYGAVSGSLFLNVKAMMKEFANHQIAQQQSANAELKKQNAELVELIKIAQNNIPVGGSKQSQERYLNFMERSTEILKQI